MRLTPNQSEALKAWRDTDSDFDVLSFKAIADRCDLPSYLIRRTVREMARKGITQYARGCWTDSGEVYGSGYGLTKNGRAMLNPSNVKELS